jgi:hypothetical protein
MERRTREDTKAAISRTTAEMGMTMTSARIRTETIVSIGSVRRALILNTPKPLKKVAAQKEREAEEEFGFHGLLPTGD